MCDKNIDIKCDWILHRGNNLETSVDINFINSSTSIKRRRPILDEIVEEKRSIFLGSDTTNICNFHLKCNEKYSIFTISLVTDCQKLELFLGKQQEYSGITYGELFDDFGGDPVYKFDIDITNPSTTELILKFINRTQELWIYGIKLYLKPKLTKISLSSVNFENVESMLSDLNHPIGSNAKKCKDFLKSYMSTNNVTNQPPKMQMLMSLANSNFEQKLNLNCNHSIIKEELNNSEEQIKNPEQNFSLQLIKQFVEMKISEIEIKINKRLDEMEKRQNEKLDRILELLTNKS